MTLKIREEYKKHKKVSETLINEAAVKWVEENVVLINEKLTYKQIEVLQNKFIKFDDVFGKVKDKLPALAQLIGSAEDELNAVTAGRSGDTSAEDMLKRMGYIYNTLSIFFSKDMKALLNAPMLRGAKENPDVKLNVLQAPKHDPSMIRDAFMDRLNPSKNQIKLLNKIYRGNLPQLDTTAIANQMLNLSYNELVELTNVGKVPMVTTSELTTATTPEKEVPSVVTNDSTPESQMAEDAIKKKLDAPIQSVVAPQVMKPMGSWGTTKQQNPGLKENVDFLTEIMDAGKLNKLVNSINNLKSAANIEGMQRLNTPMTQLIAKAKDELANNTFTEGTAVKQLIMFYNVLERIRDQWPMIKQLFADGKIDDTEVNKLKSLLTKTAKDPFFSGLAKKLFTNHYPGLEPERVASEIADAARAENGVEAVTKFFNTIQTLPNANKNGEIVGSTPTSQPQSAQNANPTSLTNPIAAQGSVLLGSDGRPLNPNALPPSVPSFNAAEKHEIGRALRKSPQETDNVLKSLFDHGFVIEKKPQ